MNILDMLIINDQMYFQLSYLSIVGPSVIPNNCRITLALDIDQTLKH